jgi:hypothetical protein
MVESMHSSIGLTLVAAYETSVRSRARGVYLEMEMFEMTMFGTERAIVPNKQSVFVY